MLLYFSKMKTFMNRKADNVTLLSTKTPAEGPKSGKNRSHHTKS